MQSSRTPGPPNSVPQTYSKGHEMDLTVPTNVARLVSEHTAMKAEIKLLKRQLKHSMAQVGNSASSSHEITPYYFAIIYHLWPNQSPLTADTPLIIQHPRMQLPMANCRF
jgi:hypothetical protein